MVNIGPLRRCIEAHNPWFRAANVLVFVQGDGAFVRPTVAVMHRGHYREFSITKEAERPEAFLWSVLIEHFRVSGGIPWRHTVAALNHAVSTKGALSQVARSLKARFDLLLKIEAVDRPGEYLDPRMRLLLTFLPWTSECYMNEVARAATDAFRHHLDSVGMGDIPVHVEATQ